MQRDNTTHWLIKTSSFLPEKCYSNDYLSSLVQTNHQWIVTRVGIHNRYICSESEDSLTMAMNVVSKMSLTSEEIKKIKVIIVATSTNHRCIPSIASSIHQQLQCEKYVMAFDINDACNGFVQSMSVAYQYVKDNGYALVVGVDHMSSIVDWSDRDTCVLFGDGAGAVLFNGNAISEYHHSSYTISRHNNALVCKKGSIVMDGRTVFNQAVVNLADNIIESCRNAMITPDDISYYILHQANERILNEVVNRVYKQSGCCIKDKMINIIKNMGNTSAATIPIAMNYRAKEIQCVGKRVMMCGFGAGLRGGSITLL